LREVLEPDFTVTTVYRCRADSNDGANAIAIDFVPTISREGF